MAISKLNRTPTKAFAVVDSRLDKPKGALYIVQPFAALAIFGEQKHAEEFMKTKGDHRSRIVPITFSLVEEQ